MAAAARQSIVVKIAIDPVIDIQVLLTLAAQVVLDRAVEIAADRAIKLIEIPWTVIFALDWA
jgi:hypothetical protein